VILHTEDGGVTWNVQESPRLYFKPWLSDVHMVSRTQGWAVGELLGSGQSETGRLLHTTTGGT
jgi:photosystem II stability/assembly factor-like uncharacterized protein